MKQQPILEDSPLKLVICQLRFPRQIGLSEADLKPVQRALAERYPTVEVGRVAELQFGPAGIAPTGEPEPVFHFRSDDRAWTVSVLRESLSLETVAYVDFAEFIRRWAEAAEAITSALELTHQERIGLRYVNELPVGTTPEPQDLGKLLRPELIGVVGAHSRTQRLLGSMQELRFGQDDGVCALRHGLVERNGTSVYVLDIDCFDETHGDLDLENQVRELAAFNHTAYELFSWAVNPEHFKSFKPKEVSHA